MWRVEVTLGDLELEAEGPTFPTPDDGPPALPFLSGVRWFEALAHAGARWPATTDVSTGTLVVLFETAAEAEWVNSSTTVAVRFYSDTAASTPDATFHGRASDPTLQVHPSGVLASIVVTDYLADLEELTVGLVDWPSERSHVRLDRVFDEAGVPSPIDPGPGASDTFYPTLAARSLAAVSALAYAQDLTGYMVIRSSAGSHVTFDNLSMVEVRPNITADLLDTVAPYELATLIHHNLAPAPGLLEEVDGVWTITWPAMDDTTVMPASAPISGLPNPPIPATVVGNLAIDAGVVRQEVAWTRRRDLDVDTVQVIRNAGNTVSAALEDPVPVVQVVETEQTNDAPAQDTADFLLPQSAPGSSWAVDKFSVVLGEATPAGYWPGNLRDVRTVHSIPVRHNPDAKTWWTGVVVAREVTLEGRSVQVDLTMVSPRGLRKWQDPTLASAPYTLTWSDLGASVPTWDTLDPTITWWDLWQVRDQA